MTSSTHPTVPTDFSIQVAENEGMPTRPNSRASPLAPAPTRRLTGTLTLGLSRTRAATNGLWSAKEQAAMRHPLARLIARTAAIADRCDVVVVPSNAYLDEAFYGPGWSCERGYEVLNGARVAIDLPENAYLDRSGNRWSCNRGFRLSDGMCILGR